MDCLGAQCAQRPGPGDKGVESFYAPLDVVGTAGGPAVGAGYLSTVVNVPDNTSDAPRAQALAHDALGRLLTQTLPNGAVNTTAYAAFETTTKGPEMAPVRRKVDGHGRLIETTRTVSSNGAPVNEIARTTYAPDDQITQVALQGGQVTYQFVYDGLGRLVGADDPDMGVRTLVHDDKNFLTGHTNGAGQSVRFRYDGAGRLLVRGPAKTTVAELGAGWMPGPNDYVFSTMISPRRCLPLGRPFLRLQPWRAASPGHASLAATSPPLVTTPRGSKTSSSGPCAQAVAAAGVAQPGPLPSSTEHSRPRVW